VRRLALVVLVVLVAAPAASAWRSPIVNERTQILHALPRFYHQACIRYAIRVSTADTHFAAVSFRFVHPTAKGCSPFDGQVLVKRVVRLRWTKIGEGSSWPCRLKGVPTRVVRDLFGGCTP
jgi:hypothetical protein